METFIKLYASVVGIAMVVIVVQVFVLIFFPTQQPVSAAPVDVDICTHVATADSIKVFYCADINLFVNQLGFMAFEP